MHKTGSNNEIVVDGPVIVGAGIVGLATAWHLLDNKLCDHVAVVDKAAGPAAHQTGHNSGVIHSGIYYRPDSKRASWCRDGKNRLVAFCRKHNLPFEMCGKVIVATRKSQTDQLHKLYERGKENKIEDIELLDARRLRSLEPGCSGAAAIRVGSAGITDFSLICQKLAELIRQNGGSIYLEKEVSDVAVQHDGLRLKLRSVNHPGGGESDLNARFLINCAGLQSDRIAIMAGQDPGARIIPFRGEYYKIKSGKQHLVRNLIYPLPDERFPFLGVHCTRMINGEAECGPNAVFSLSREGYSRWDVNKKDLKDALTYNGFRKLAQKYWKTGLKEVQRSFSKRAFTRAVQELVPDLKKDDLVMTTPGIRATAIDPGGRIIDDFHMITGNRQLHVINAPSPAATAAFRIGEEIAKKMISSAS